jgi:2-succinyl-6-hydroxy-2,4-cyclohexadiene-1-carboxylate synthase
MESFLEMTKKRLNVHHFGSGNTRILFLHGFLGTGADGQFLAELPRVSVFAPDLPGHGDSVPFEKPEDAAPAPLAAAVADAVQEFGPFDLVAGYSLGGRLAREFLERRSVASTRWLFYAAWLGFHASGEAFLRRKEDHRKAIDLLVNPDDFFEKWNKQSLFGPSRNEPSGHKTTHPESAAWLLEHFSAGTQSRLEKIPEKCRIGMVFGANDPKFSAHYKAMAIVLEPSLLLEIPGAWHRVIKDNPDACRNAAQKMLQL